MDKTIENKLFAEFQNGAAAMCLEYVKNVIANNGETLVEHERGYYSAFPAKVEECTNSFDDIAWPENITGQYRIAQEISDNLDNYKDDSQRERYIIEIISVFEKWGEIFTPVTRLKELDKMLKYGCTINSEEEIKQEIERVSNLHDYYVDIMRDAEKGTMEYYLDIWHRAYHKFSKMLAAICAEHHINLLELQEKRGIWIIEKLDALDLQCYFGYFGSLNYANNLLKELPRTAATEGLIYTERNGIIRSEAAWKSEDADMPSMSQPTAKSKSTNIITERAAKYFEIGCNEGLMKKTENGYKWLWGGSTRLAYFLQKIYNWDGYQVTPFKQLEEIFGVKRLDSATHRLDEVKTPQRWRERIDNIFKD